MGCRLETLRCADDDGFVGYVGQGEGVDLARMSRRDSAKHDLSVTEDLADIRRRLHAGRDGNARQIGFVFAVVADRLGDRRFAHPYKDFMLAATSAEHDGKAGAPATASEDGDAAHGDPPFDLPTRYFGSEPDKRRCKFALCL